MIEQSTGVDEGFVITMVKKAASASVPKSSTAEAGQIPVSDGQGGVTWGAATTGTVGAVDSNSDGHVVLQFVEGE